MKIELNSGKWILLTDTESKTEHASQLLKLVNVAYMATPLGSFLKTNSDILPSDWEVADVDDDTEIDACIFMRKSRPSESWTGYKIQGIGHDGSIAAKAAVVSRLVKLLSVEGHWIEVSDALQRVLSKHLIPVTDEETLTALFPNCRLTMLNRTHYRRVANGVWITESVFGIPKLK